MMQFCNAYTCAANKGSKEIVINFSQKYPEIQADGKVVNEHTEILSSIVFRPDLAKSLAQDILEMLSAFDD